MALKQSLEKNGLFLFRYRGQIPVFIFLLGLPFIFFKYYTKIYLVFALMFDGNVDLLFNILAVVGIIVSFAGLCIRAYTIGTTPRGTSGRNTKEQVANELNSTGMYSMVRHPLYLGNYLMWAGLLIFIGSIPLFIIISLLYWIYYERIMYAEECFLEKQFGEKYTEWSMTVPPFFPKIGSFVKSNIPFSFKAVLRREYAGFFATVLCFVIVDYIRAYGISMVMNYNFEWIRTSLYCLIGAGIITITLRSLKHYTKVLSDDNRD
ncbi:MAG: DUF1295 domain-containing protein [Bacteroidales bacterium]|nr:DUF1295 domain-containing protein [Bacteroidales bacterium]